jgi:hypothetical protein
MYLSISTVEKLEQFLKLISEYLPGIVLYNCVLIFLHVVFAETLSSEKCYTSPRTHDVGFFPSFMCSAYSMFWWWHFFLMWWCINHFMNFESLDSELNPSPVVSCMALVSLLMLKLLIRALSFYHSF